MRNAQGLITTAEAIRLVFNVPINISCRPAFCPRLCFRTTRRDVKPYSIANSRSARYKAFSEHGEPTSRGGQIDPLKYGPKVERPPRDEEIQESRVVVRLPNSRLSEPRALQDVLRERMKDEKGKFTNFVQVVAEADPSAGRRYPIVGYFGKKEMKERELAAKKKEKSSVPKEKSIELSWSIGDHDLRHRMERLQEFLQKGKRVEVLFGSRGWRIMKRAVTENEASALLEKIRQAALEVEGGQMMQDFKGTILREGSMIFHRSRKISKEPNGGREERELSGDMEYTGPNRDVEEKEPNT